MWSSTLLLDLWLFLPLILDVRELNEVLLLSHPCPQQSALGTRPEHLLPGPESSGFLGFSNDQTPGRGGVYASSASTVHHCHDNNAGSCLDAGSTVPLVSLGVLHDIGHPIPKGYVMEDRVRTVPMSWQRRWYSYPDAAGSACGAHPSLVSQLYFQGPVIPLI